MNLGIKQIKKFKDDNDLNLTETAEITGIGKSILSQYFNGMFNPSFDRIKKALECIDVDILFKSNNTGEVVNATKGESFSKTLKNK